MSLDGLFRAAGLLCSQSAQQVVKATNDKQRVQECEMSRCRCRSSLPVSMHIFLCYWPLEAARRGNKSDNSEMR